MHANSFKTDKIMLLLGTGLWTCSRAVLPDTWLVTWPMRRERRMWCGDSVTCGIDVSRCLLLYLHDVVSLFLITLLVLLLLQCWGQCVSPTSILPSVRPSVRLSVYPSVCFAVCLYDPYVGYIITKISPWGVNIRVRRANKRSEWHLKDM